MTNEQKMEHIEELFDVEHGALTPDMELASIKEWGSLAQLSLIVMIDDECGKTIKNDDIKALKTIQDIMNIMD